MLMNWKNKIEESYEKLFLFALVAFAIGCSKDAGTDEPHPSDQPSEQPEMVTVSFAVKGDATIEEDPLPISRAAGEETESTDLYGINIYYDKEKDGLINDVYGYGLFDNVADMTVSLLTGYKYKFVCSLVKDGKNKIFKGFSYYYQKGYSDYKGYGAPFWKARRPYMTDSYSYPWSYSSEYSDTFFKDAPTILENKFVLGTRFHLTGLGQGWGHEKNKPYIDDIDCYSHNFTCHFPADRYYGETTDYIPKESGVVNISMKRCSFGAKFVVTGVTDGTVSFTVGEWINEYDWSKSGITSDTTYESEIHTYDNVYDCWQKAMEGQDFSQDFILDIVWKRGNGVIQRFDPMTVTFKRNILTTVNIRLNGGDTNNRFNLDIDNTEMGEENTDFDVNAGDMTDTPVDPTE